MSTEDGFLIAQEYGIDGTGIALASVSDSGAVRCPRTIGWPTAVEPSLAYDGTTARLMWLDLVAVQPVIVTLDETGAPLSDPVYVGRCAETWHVSSMVADGAVTYVLLGREPFDTSFFPPDELWLHRLDLDGYPLQPAEHVVMNGDGAGSYGLLRWEAELLAIWTRYSPAGGRVGAARLRP